jgi:hypothetical protein
MNYVIYDTNGKIMAMVGCISSEIEAAKERLRGAGYCQVSELATENMYFDGTGVKQMPEKPTSYHVFDYTTKQWFDPRTPETQWPIVRQKRNQRLQATDWTQLGDVPAATKALWESYRQALRDITNQPDPFNVVWPTPPQ